MIQVPIGAEEKFAGIVDLVRMKAIYWDDATQGTKFEVKDIPAELKEVCDEWREKMVEAAAEANEDLMTRYLEGHTLSVDDGKCLLGGGRIIEVSQRDAAGARDIADLRLAGL